MNTERLRHYRPLPGWTKTPLVAFAVVSIGPLVLILMEYPVLRWLGVEGLRDDYNFYTAIKMLFSEIAVLMTLTHAAMNWPFFILYRVCRRELEGEGANLRVIRLAMFCSVIAMIIPNLHFFSPAEFLSTAPDASQRAGAYMAVFVAVPVPILGLVGWFLGDFLESLSELV